MPEILTVRLSVDGSEHHIFSGLVKLQVEYHEGFNNLVFSPIDITGNSTTYDQLECTKNIANRGKWIGKIFCIF